MADNSAVSWQYALSGDPRRSQLGRDAINSVLNPDWPTTYDITDIPNPPVEADSSDSANSAIQEQYEYNLKLQKDAQEFNERMRDTQYQSVVEDLKKAGLNPWLAVNSLHGSAPTSSASSVSQQPSTTENVKNMSSSALAFFIIFKALLKLAL